MDTEIREMRELLIELRLNLQHLTNRVDVSLGRTQDQISRIEERLYTAERNIWIACGGIALLSTMLPYLLQWLKER
jgi:hypothetical protein